MKSFNLGAPGATMLEILFITNNLLNEDLINPNSTLFVEVQPIYTLDEILSARHTYYRNPKDFNLVVGDVSIKNWKLGTFELLKHVLPSVIELMIPYTGSIQSK